MDIFKLANEIAGNMSSDEKQSMEEMDMDKMISHVTKNVFKMMGGLKGLHNERENTPEKVIPAPHKISYPRTKDIRFDLNVDLEDFYMGKKKKLNVRRKRVQLINGKEVVVEEKKRLVIPIEKGMKDGTQIKFAGEADQLPSHTPGDIIINLIENEHEFFQRDGDNLVIIKNINLSEVYSLNFFVKHLDNTVIKIGKEPLDVLQLDDCIRKVAGKGMPIHKTNKHGDLFIRFNVVIPKKLELATLEKVKEIFNEKYLSEYEKSIHVNSILDEFVLENVNSDSDVSDLELSEEGSSSELSDSEVSDLQKQLDEINSDSD
jgi:DnaJ-class molecular chaperone